MLVIGCLGRGDLSLGCWALGLRGFGALARALRVGKQTIGLHPKRMEPAALAKAPKPYNPKTPMVWMASAKRIVIQTIPADSLAAAAMRQ